MGAVVLGHHHDPGRVLVEPVHDAGPPLAADAGETFAAVRNESVDQRPSPVAGGGMNHKITGFIDDDQVAVLVNDAERNGFGLGFGRDRRRHINQDCRAGIDLKARIADRLTVDSDRAGFNQDLESRTRQFADVAGEHAVKPVARLVRGDHNGGPLIRLRHGGGGHHE